MDNLKSLKWEGVEKKRTSQGYFLINVKIRTLQEIKVIPNNKGNHIFLGKSKDELNFDNNELYDKNN